MGSTIYSEINFSTKIQNIFPIFDLHYAIFAIDHRLCEVVLLDDNKISLRMSPQAYVRDVFGEVSVRLRLNAGDGCFGLATVVQNEMMFLPMSARLGDYMPSQTAVILILYFCVEFYLEPHSSSGDAVYWYFRQLLADVLQNRIRGTKKDLQVLGGLALQGLYGDHTPSRHGEEYFDASDYWPASLSTDGVTAILTGNLFIFQVC